MAKAAAWIASELGEHAAPLIPELIPLLEHDSRYVRFFAVDTVLSAAGLEHGAAIGTAISRLLVDSDDAVRWKLLNLLARASDEQLEVAVPYIDDPPLASAVSWLSDPNIDTAQRMMHGTPLDRIIGTAGAVRLGEEGLPLLREISHSCDIELSSFASEMLRQRT
jgi:HEAT repeat protein